MDDAFLKVDGKCQVTISDDRMNTWITLSSPKNGGAPVTMDQVTHELYASGVIANINQLAVEESVLLSLWDKPHLVAIGAPCDEGRDGYVNYHFPLPDEVLKPLETENGKVDFHNLNLIHNVKTGDLLAERFPAIEGKDGWTVTGKVIHPAPVKNPALVGGRDTILEPPGTRLFAAKDGHATFVDGRPSVISVYSVKHDVNFAVGNIDFVGNVQIFGDVKSGFIVKAGGDVEVFGMVESAEVHAGGNILIKNGVFGAGKCTMTAGGNILARYVENANLKAGKDVVVIDSISRSQVRAGGKIKVSGISGDIVGGHLEALEEITAGVFGSEIHVPTVLELGIEPRFRSEYVELMGKFKEKKKSLLALETYIIEYKGYRENKKAVSESYKQTMRGRLRQYSQLRGEIEIIEQKLLEYEVELARLNHGTVKATQKVYPGVTVSIVKTKYFVEEEMTRVMFLYDKGVVTPAPLRG
ncbi:MAG: hypothetical protein C0401_08400 [Anaerolinea sp.]|nr:hypothetical protein [Anaerolinea sp.]